MIHIMEEEEPITILIASLSSLSPPQHLRISHSLSSLLHRRHRRLFTILSSSTLFSLTLRRLRSLSLPAKLLILARHLLSSLRHLVHHLHPRAAATSAAAAHIFRLPDHDAALLLLLLCDLRHHEPDALSSAPHSEWRGILGRYFFDAVFSVSGLGESAFVPFIEGIAQCQRLLDSMDCENKGGRETAASPAAVVALPSVAAGDGGGVTAECAICREEMEQGRDVCEMPCQHRFHWMCILPWVRERNTCPCCRFRLATDDVFGEIQRLWDVLVKIGGGSRIQGGDTANG